MSGINRDGYNRIEVEVESMVNRAIERRFMIYSTTSLLPRCMTSGIWIWNKPFYYLVDCNDAYRHYLRQPIEHGAPKLRHVYRWSEHEYFLATMRGIVVDGKLNEKYYTELTKRIDLLEYR